MFDKKQESCVKRIDLVIDEGLYDRKAFYTVKMVFYSSSMSNCFTNFSTRSTAVQCPTNNDPQYEWKILSGLLDQPITYPYCFFTWELVVSSKRNEYGVFFTS